MQTNAVRETDSIKQSPEPAGPARGKGKLRTQLGGRNRIALVGVATCVAAAILAPAVPAAASAGPCYSGTDSGTTDWAWGSCTNVTGNTQWRLHVSCTWGSTVYSSWIHGNARTDVQCPYPGSVRATIIETMG